MTTTAKDAMDHRGSWWVVSAFVTFCFLGGVNFLSGVIGKEAAAPSDAGKSNATVQLLVEGAVGVLAAAIVILKKGARALTPDARATVALMASGALFAVGILLITTALASDFVMAPFITGILPTNAIFLVVACRAFLGERTTFLQLTAIAVAVVGLAVMAAANTSIQGLRGCLFGLITAILFAAGNFLMKYASLRVTMDHLASTTLVWVAMGLVGLVFFCVETVINGMLFKGLHELSTDWEGRSGGSSGRLYLFSLASAVLQVLGMATMKLTVCIGPSAPGMAISNANAIAVLALETIFFQPHVNAQQVAGLATTIIGIGVLSAAPTNNDIHTREEDGTAPLNRPMMASTIIDDQAQQPRV